ncbi:GatB/YqeY domain-containing protein [Acetobacteraceae bacterium KSS8]|uniref:GatB/YqeY domain-containing protein n=1 Tax=Endosaccharibacter trunci TaxID=2812733 RepID=A0ABT1W2F5_9PROT|nr:GatB/YqeY domain-containing protein [Acetobacteraceae bacterium KSS8]
MSLRQRFGEALKQAMRDKDSVRLGTIRMINARLKDLDIAARPKGIDGIPDEEIVSALRNMVKSRREAAALYLQGGRGELAAKEDAEIVVIEEFLPAPMDDAALTLAVADAVAETGAGSMKDMGKVMAALKAKHGADLDLGRANALVKARLSA